VNGTLGAADGGRWRLRFTRHLAHPPDVVLRAVTDPAELAAWFPQRVVGDVTVPGAALRFESDGFPSFDGVVLRVEPPRLLEIGWGTEVVRFEIEAAGEGCTLTLVDTIDELGKAARDGAGWHTCLDLLEAALDGGGAPVDIEQRWAEVHPGYVEAFGPAASTLGPPDPAGGA